jgi:hypothetical protein
MTRATSKRRKSRKSTRGLVSRTSLNGKRLRKHLRAAAKTKRSLRRGIL